jgi:predicted transcriptional regulator
LRQQNEYIAKSFKKQLHQRLYGEVKLLILLNRIVDTRRNYLQILSDILEFCKTPQSKTRILHVTNTNFKQLERYLLQLQTSGLVEKRQGIEFSTTKKGTEFIETWAKLLETLRPENIPPTG